MSRGTPAWRICDNPRSNDWNTEPEKIIVPYTVLGESKRGNAYLVERNGWHGKRHQHYIAKREFFFDKQLAEEALRSEEEKT